MRKKGYLPGVASYSFNQPQDFQEIVTVAERTGRGISLENFERAGVPKDRD
jgi:hypothetical protein